MKKGVTQLVFDFILGAAVIMIVDHLFDGVYVKDFQVAFLIAIILAILNTFIKPILTFLAFPFTIMTFGLFQLVINGFVLSLAQNILSPDFHIHSFGLTIVVSVIISILYSLLGIGRIDE